MPATPVWLAAIESVLNRSIDHKMQARIVACRLDHTCLDVQIEGFGCIRAAFCADRLSLTTGGEMEATAVIAGSPLALLNLVTRGAGHSGAAVQVSGDAAVAGGYRELLALARPELEEELARLTGDLPARRVSLLAQGIFGWLRRLEHTARENLAEYLQEESRDLAGRYEVDEFVQSVDRLRDTAERVEARLARLEQRLKGRS